MCGPKAYQIVEAFPFLALSPPSSGVVETDPWTLSLETTNMADVGIYTATIRCTLMNYPAVAPVDLLVDLQILHPCSLTTLTPQTPSDMVFSLGYPLTVKEYFIQFADSISALLADPKLCGERAYSLTGLPFLNLMVPPDPWIAPIEVQLWTTDPS